MDVTEGSLDGSLDDDELVVVGTGMMNTHNALSNVGFMHEGDANSTVEEVSHETRRPHTAPHPPYQSKSSSQQAHNRTGALSARISSFEIIPISISTFLLLLLFIQSGAAVQIDKTNTITTTIIQTILSIYNIRALNLRPPCSLLRQLHTSSLSPAVPFKKIHNYSRCCRSR